MPVRRKGNFFGETSKDLQEFETLGGLTVDLKKRPNAIPNLSTPDRWDAGSFAGASVDLVCCDKDRGASRRTTAEIREWGVFPREQLVLTREQEFLAREARKQSGSNVALLHSIASERVYIRRPSSFTLTW